MTGDINTAIKIFEKIPCPYGNYIHVCVDRQFLKLTRELSIYLSNSDKYYGEKAGKIVLRYVCERKSCHFKQSGRRRHFWQGDI